MHAAAKHQRKPFAFGVADFAEEREALPVPRQRGVVVAQPGVYQPDYNPSVRLFSPLTPGCKGVVGAHRSMQRGLMSAH